MKVQKSTQFSVKDGVGGSIFTDRPQSTVQLLPNIKYNLRPGRFIFIKNIY